MLLRITEETVKTGFVGLASDLEKRWVVPRKHSPIAGYFLSSYGSSGSYPMPAETAPVPQLAMVSMKDASIYQKLSKTRSPL